MLRSPRRYRCWTEAISRGVGVALDGALFHFDDDRPSFEDYGDSNGFRFWFAGDLAEFLGYEALAPSFSKIVNKAMAACGALNIPIPENFQEVSRELDGMEVRDWKLSRFACCLCAMKADQRKPAVRAAQAYFAAITAAFGRYVEETEGIERVVIRSEISEQESGLAATAHLAGVENYALFQNAGYRGLYNMNLKQLRSRRAVEDGRSPLDFMGPTELAANLFRITQTQEKIAKENVTGQTALEKTHESVGRKVREAMVEISGTRPEELPIFEDIKGTQKGLKGANRELRKLDKKRLTPPPSADTD